MNTSLIKTILTKLGVKEDEIVIYLYLCTSDVESVQQISEAVAINRTTCYRYLESLRDKNLIEWVIDKRGRKVKASSPDNLLLLLEKRKSTITEVEKNLLPLISQLKIIKPNKKFDTQVRYFKGEEGIKQMIWNTLRTKEPLRSYTILRRREVIDPKFEDKFEYEWVRRRLSDYTITNETRIPYIKNRLLAQYRKTVTIKIIPSKKFYISNDIAIYNNIVSIASLEKDNLVGIEIENEEIVKTQKSIFDIVWEGAKPLREYL
jgi:sugar-specific transcriptional regulator TrmB